MQLTQKPADAFTQTITIDKPVDAVWRAIVRKADIDKYYLAPIGSDITHSTQSFYYGTPEHKFMTAEVVTLEAPHRLAHTFRFTGSNDGVSLVTYRLTPAGNGTRLDLEHSGYAPDSQSFSDISGGWPIILGRLKAHVEASAD